MPNTTIERDLVDDDTGCPRSCKHEVVTRPEDFPELSAAQVLDLHAAQVEIEKLAFSQRIAAKRHLHLIGWDAGSGLCTGIFAEVIREAIRRAQDRTIS